MVFSQELTVLSAKDKLAVSFAVVSIKSNDELYQYECDVNGRFAISNKLADTVKYTLTVKSVSFISFNKTLMGNQFKSLSIVYLNPDSIQLKEVVVTGQYVPTSAEKSIQKIQIIDKEKIQQMGAVNLKDVLSNQLNVRLQQDNILGAGMSLQGISGENVKILMDGVPLIGRMNGNIDLSQINMNNVERIEYIEGPLSVQYGTNALAGTINIITKSSSEKKIKVGLTGYYESIGTYNLNTDMNFLLKKHSIQISVGRNYFDGWNSDDSPFYLSKTKIADSSRYKQWKPKEQYFSSVGYGYSFKKINFGFKSSFFDEKIINRGYPRAPYAETSFDDYYYTKRIDNNIYLNGKLCKKWSVNSLLAYNYYRRIKKTVYKDLTTLDETLSHNSADQDTSKFTLLMSRASFVRQSDSLKINYELGYDVNYESAFGKRINNQTQYMGDYALFTTMEYKPIHQLVIKPGLRYAYNTLYKSPIIPSLSLKYDIRNNHTIRASYAKGFRAPSLKELYFLFVDINHNIVGNVSLKSEQSDNYALSYSYKTTREKAQFKLGVNTFYNEIYNLITLAQTSSAEYSYVNIGKYKTVGAQISSNVKFKSLNFQTGFNYTGRYNELAGNSDVPNFSFSTEVSGNASYAFIKSKATISLFYKYNGKLPGYMLVNDNIIQTSLAYYHTMDATISKKILKYFDLTIGCKNLFNVKNLSSTAITGGVHSSSSNSVPLSTGRNYFIKLTINLFKE